VKYGAAARAEERPGKARVARERPRSRRGVRALRRRRNASSPGPSGKMNEKYCLGHNGPESGMGYPRRRSQNEGEIGHVRWRIGRAGWGSRQAATLVEARKKGPRE